MEAISQYRPPDCPPVLYKYITLRDERKYYKSLLLENAAFFSSAKLFNDPFDCSIKIRFDLATEAYRAKMGKEYIKRRLPTLPRAERRRKMNPKAYAAGFRKREQPEKYEKDIRELIYNQIGIFCMSEVKDNILMWAHYADAHKGLCLCFDMDRLWEFCLRLHEEKGLDIAPYKVEYSEIYPLLIPNPDNEKDIAMKHILTKAIDWKHEKEHRILYVGRSNEVFNLYDDIISEVIIGCRMNDSDQEEIKSLLSNRANKPKLFRAKPKDDSFGLDIVPMDY